MESRRALIDQCFNEFEKGKWSFLTPHFMKKAQEEFILALEIVRKYLGDPEAFKELKAFVDDLEFGHWTTARQEFPSAKKEYVKFLKVVEEIKTPESERDDKSRGNSKGRVANLINDNRSGANIRPKSYQPPNLEMSKERDSNIRPSSYRFPMKNDADNPINLEQFPSDRITEEPSGQPNWSRRVRIGKLGESRLGRPGVPEPYEETVERYQPFGPETYRDSAREDRPRIEDRYRKTQSEGLDKYRENRYNDVDINKMISEGPGKLGSDRPSTYRKNQNEGSDMSKEVRSNASDPDRRNHSNVSDKFRDELHLNVKKSSEQDKLSTARDIRLVESVRDQYKGQNNATQSQRGNNPTVRQDDNSGETLDDYNRAVRLAERFLVLYNNEYVEAFNELKRHRYFERDAVFYLLRFVKQAYDFCLLHRDKMLDEEVNGLDFRGRAALRNRQVDKGFKRHLLDRRKRTAQFVLSKVLKEYFEFAYERLLPHYPLDETARMKIRRYAERCVVIVWGFCTQEPPVCMKWPSDRKQGEAVDLFNLEFYQPYTKPEKYVDYCVWPLLLLHENGTILKKGIVQGISI
ncbi:hypothetical protein CHS0354_020461 [Potamilus streckersoni]|uniref:Mitochondria-eating protein C-terminal domain-containing protein n=1 Tax=Potamilus streckersoni TaxID=2493646 RepID=A0AAE0TB84_9BIVA|nr:hypothetical protein CHS0354_020461 [Potamilus streckersoni]